jgi:GDPmannose 4,6-dehydratase
MLEAIRILGFQKKTRFYQASTSEMFGKAQEVPQSESTAFYPRSPYGVAKLYAHWITASYRDTYGIYACSGILFNHESPVRGETFVTRKIVRALTRIHLGSQDCVYLGNLDALRDWGHARDYVEAMWLMLQQDRPEDFVVATGTQHSVRDFVGAVAAELEIKLRWQGIGRKEEAFNAATGVRLVAIDPRYLRPAEVDNLLGNATRAREKLGWTPRTTFGQLVSEMVREELKLARLESLGTDERSALSVTKG